MRPCLASRKHPSAQLAWESAPALARPHWVWRLPTANPRTGMAFAGFTASVTLGTRCSHASCNPRGCIPHRAIRISSNHVLGRPGAISAPKQQEITLHHPAPHPPPKPQPKQTQPWLHLGQHSNHPNGRNSLRGWRAHVYLLKQIHNALCTAIITASRSLFTHLHSPMQIMRPIGRRYMYM